ncbi:lysoplasmalogenase [Pseudoalteromonas sp. C2R02]|uniref:lysoplasmalogenase n=1 Tax=Pseudoalteromonas sp. C2R02 TaxID=2841565 RepID=UPI001C09A4DD|nr:lysoplasmalogenase [Pseudoalteromonas sp. C2R02]MBU2971891.1 lysoplasmalogenase [Pseudoalteromonas sp. C2R02]
MLLFLTFITLFGLCHIIADHYHKTHFCYILKPLTTLTILSLALYLTEFELQYYALLIIFGLLFSLIGDIFLMLKSDKFMQGLVSFLIAHIFYIVAFLDSAKIDLNLYAIIPITLIGIGYLTVLLPKTGNLKIPVLIYALVLQAMVITADMFYQTALTTNSLMVLIGAIWFMLSDSILAFARFVKTFKFAQPAVLSTYYIAQTFIVLSLK